MTRLWFLTSLPFRRRLFAVIRFSDCVMLIVIVFPVNRLSPGPPLLLMKMILLLLKNLNPVIMIFLSFPLLVLLG